MGHYQAERERTDPFKGIENGTEYAVFADKIMANCDDDRLRAMGWLLPEDET